MTKDSETRIHERLDELVSNVGDIARDLAVVASTCDACRPKIMGNGKASLPERVRALEERSRLVIAVLVVAVGIASSLMTTLIAAAWR